MRRVLCSSTRLTPSVPSGEHALAALDPNGPLNQTSVSSVVFRYDSTSGGEREIQRTMLELLNQLDGFDSRGDVKVG